MFTPVLSGSVQCAVSATSTNYALVAYPANAPKDNRAVRTFVLGGNGVHIEFHNSAAGVTATSGVAFYIPPTTEIVVGINGDVTRVVALAVSGPSLTNFTIGYVS